MTFLKDVEKDTPDLEVLSGDLHPKGVYGGTTPRAVHHKESKLPSFTLLFILWILGLAAWFYFIVSTNKITIGVGGKRKPTSKANTYKDK
jgi:hypothetical protein